MARPYTVSEGNSATPPTAMQRSKVSTSSSVTAPCPSVTRSWPGEVAARGAAAQAARAPPPPGAGRARAPAGCRAAPGRSAPGWRPARRPRPPAPRAARSGWISGASAGISPSATYGRLATTRSNVAAREARGQRSPPAPGPAARRWRAPPPPPPARRPRRSPRGRAARGAARAPPRRCPCPRRAPAPLAGSSSATSTSSSVSGRGISTRLSTASSMWRKPLRPRM